MSTRQSTSPTNLKSGSNRRIRRQAEQQPAYLGIPEAAAYLDVDHKTIRRLIASKRLAGYRLGNRIIKIKVADLDAVLTPMHGGVA
ncbi:helix-turn-helix domain-containing protein [Mycobacterium sp. 1081908.1]|uniref:helix-turn-helix domain-containing protein n=1 Tax=Mycobacterium sp. 1081908.1 TaxID=1834066 RepID=UPI000A9C2259|nr:helix-turn-helix domain-containing protein [Mycobacterium sp. 1081908.1]